MGNQDVAESNSRPDTWIPAALAMDEFDAVIGEGGWRLWDAGAARAEIASLTVVGAWIRYRDATSAMAAHEGVKAIGASTAGMDRIKERWLRARVSMTALAAASCPVPEPVAELVLAQVAREP